MDPIIPIIVSIASLCVAVVAVGCAIYFGNKNADSDYVAELERRLGRMEKHAEACDKEAAALRTENMRLMRRVLGLPDEIPVSY